MTLLVHLTTPYTCTCTHRGGLTRFQNENVIPGTFRQGGSRLALCSRKPPSLRSQLRDEDEERKIEARRSSATTPEIPYYGGMREELFDQPRRLARSPDSGFGRPASVLASKGWLSPATPTPAPTTPDRSPVESEGGPVGRGRSGRFTRCRISRIAAPCCRQPQSSRTHTSPCITAHVQPSKGATPTTTESRGTSQDGIVSGGAAPG